MIHSTYYTKEAIGLYIHWPFCLSKCPYCDFNSHVAQHIPQEEYAAAFLKELEHALLTGANHSIRSIFFGGGTPSLMDPKTVDQLINFVHQHCSFTDDIEITLEANPTSIEAQKFKDFKQAGVNRISIGVQSLNPDALKALGREHSVTQALDALNVAKAIFDRISFDLIYAREGQTPQEWQQELKQALELANDHLSLYQLTIEPGTLFAKYYQQGKLHLPSEEISTELLCATNEITEQYGLNNYEISNYAKPGSESRHNLIYWRYQDYIGIGPGAHGRVTEQGNLYATERYRNPQKWLNHVHKNGHGIEVKEVLSSIDKAREMILMGLRLNEGINADRLEKRCGLSLKQVINKTMLDALQEEDYISWDGTVLKTTSQGKLRLNAILEALLT